MSEIEDELGPILDSFAPANGEPNPSVSPKSTASFVALQRAAIPARVRRSHMTHAGGADPHRADANLRKF